jgi:hypothetical protein
MTEPLGIGDDRIYCDCVGTLIRRRWQHATDCPHWAPPPRGPGSTTAARQAAMAEIRAAIAAARARHQETQP